MKVLSLGQVRLANAAMSVGSVIAPLNVQLLHVLFRASPAFTPA
jgi:hypothetical protein